MKTLRTQIIITGILTIVFCTGVHASDTNNHPQSNKSEINYTSESDISLESWMYDLTKWNINLSNTNYVSGEEEIEIENWMLNATSEFWSLARVMDSESKIELEDWMTDLSMW